MKKKTLWTAVIYAAAAFFFLFITASCGGPRVTYTAKVGAVNYPPVAPSEVKTFESTPQKGSYIELGEIVVEDEMKCEIGKAFGEEKALQIMERLRKDNPDLSDVTDITMLELLAERGGIDRSDICDLLPRFSRREEKIDFVKTAIMGCNLEAIKAKAGEAGANAVMKIDHNDWQIRQKPSSFGADATQVPALKIGVKSTAVAVNYEGPEKGAVPSMKEKILVVVKDKKEEKKAEGEPAKEEKKAKKAKKEEKKEPAKAAKKKPEPPPEKEKKEAAAKEKKPPAEKKGEAPESEILLHKATQAEKEIADLEGDIKGKKKDQAELKKEIAKDEEKLKSLKRQIVKLKIQAKKAKAEEEKARKEAERKAKAEEKRLALLKKVEEKKKKKEEAEKKEKAEEKKEKGKKEKEDAEEKEKDDDVKVEEAVVGAKDKIKASKGKIFDCLHEGKMKGDIKVIFLFKPSGKIDALGFTPDAPEEVHKCIMTVLKKEEFKEAPRYYKAIFKYKIK